MINCGWACAQVPEQEVWRCPVGQASVQSVCPRQWCSLGPMVFKATRWHVQEIIICTCGVGGLGVTGSLGIPFLLYGHEPQHILFLQSRMAEFSLSSHLFPSHRVRVRPHPRPDYPILSRANEPPLLSLSLARYQYSQSFKVNETWWSLDHNPWDDFCCISSIYDFGDDSNLLQNHPCPIIFHELFFHPLDIFVNLQNFVLIERYRSRCKLIKIYHCLVSQPEMRWILEKKLWGYKGEWNFLHSSPSCNTSAFSLPRLSAFGAFWLADETPAPCH
jgi:hypothetical protein